MAPSGGKRKRYDGGDEAEDPEGGLGADEAGGHKKDDLLFRIQIGELLREVRGRDDASEADAQHTRLCEHISALTGRVKEGWVVSSESGDTFLTASTGETVLPCAKDTKITAEPPEAFEILGSLPRGMCEERSGVITVDVAVVIPDSVFTKKDFLSHRYAGKRALYLAALVKSLHRVKGAGKALRYEWFNNDATKPIVVSTLPWENKSVEVRFLPCISPSTFETHKLHPLRNNIKGALAPLARPKDWRRGGRAYAEKNENGELVTPAYTSAIAEDAMALLNHRFATEAMAQSPVLADATVLLKIWLRKHDLVLDHFGMTGHFFTMVAAWVWKSREISDHASTLQVFKILLEGLESLDFESGESLRTMAAGGSAALGIKDPPSKNVFANAFESVFLDCTGWVNLAARMPGSAVAMVKTCASSTIRLLNSFLPPETKFEKLFLMKSYFGMHFDHHFRVSLGAGDDPTAAVFGGDLTLWQDQERLVEHVTRLALGKRITCAHCRPRLLRPQVIRKKDKTAKVAVGAPRLADQEIDLFLCTNEDLASSLVDVGPANTEKDLCKNFRSFWGEKAQLRQFKDTSIAEAVIWPNFGSTSPHPLMLASLRHALERNLATLGRAAEVRVTTRESALDVLADDAGVLGDKAQAMRSFDKLSRMLRTMDGLPLKIESLQTASSVFRCTDPLPLRKHKLCGTSAAKESRLYKSFVPVIECVAGLEGIRRWPKNPDVQEKKIAALNLEIADCLQKSFGITCIGTEDHVDVLYEGYAFRLRLQALTGPSHLAKRTYIEALKHHSAISGLAAKHASYCSVVKIAKRWLGSHLMSPHLEHETVELLVAEAYCNPSCLGAPASRWSGFLRFLHTLSSFPWEERPMYVDAVQGEPGSAEGHQSNLAQLEKRFQDFEEKGEVRVAASYHQNGGHRAPTAAGIETRKVAARSAQSSLTFLDREMRSGYQDFGRKVLSVFTPNLKHFDVLLSLHPESVPLLRYFVCVSEGARQPETGGSDSVGDHVSLQTVKNTGGAETPAKLILGENLALEAVKSVQDVLGDRAFVGYDEFGGTTVGISWNPSFFLPRSQPPTAQVDFSLSVSAGGEADPVYIPNTFAVMAEVCEKLRGFVSKVAFLA